MAWEKGDSDDILQTTLAKKMKRENILANSPQGYRLLHTADWHLGKEVAEKACVGEHQKFLDWLIDFIPVAKVNAVLVCGDIFDHKAVSNSTRLDYVRLIDRFCELNDVEIFLLAGNHDSADFLDADRELYEKRLHIHVIGKYLPADEAHFRLGGRNSAPGIMLIPVPYIDKRASQQYQPDGEEYDSESRYSEALRLYFRKATDAAIDDNADKLPLVLAAHMAIGGKSGSFDRCEYLGNLPPQAIELFPDELSYVALGHIHKPYFADGNNRIRYSGSIMPMSADENDDKSVMLLEFRANGEHAFQEISVPVLLNQFHLRGTEAEILDRAREITQNAKVRTICRFSYTAPEIRLDMENRIRKLCLENDNVEVISVSYEGSGAEENSDGQKFGVGAMEGRRLDVEHPEKLIDELLKQFKCDDERRPKLMAILMDRVLPLAKENLDNERKRNEDNLAQAQSKLFLQMSENIQKNCNGLERDVKKLEKQQTALLAMVARKQDKATKLAEKAERQKLRLSEEEYANWCIKNRLSDVMNEAELAKDALQKNEQALEEDRKRLSQLRLELEKCAVREGENGL